MFSENLETPYEEEDEYIECVVCEKSLRGTSLYKIHLTTSAHLKRENCLVAEVYPSKILEGKTKQSKDGKAVRQHIVPKFKDIVEYLEYLNLDEPIIGLNFLEEVPSFEPQLGPKYNCRLCNQSGVIVEMICHVIGRKHRQKYVEIERPDLVTWNNQTVKTQVGKSIRAKAEIVERQDGRGAPKLLLRRKVVEGSLNITRVPPNQRQKRNQNIPENAHHGVPPLLPEFNDYKEKKKLSGFQENPRFYPDEPPMKKWFGVGDAVSHNRFEEKPGRSDYREGFDYRKDFRNPDIYDPFENECGEKPQSSGMSGPHNVPRYGYGEQMPHDQAQDSNYYPAGAPPFKRPYPGRDALEEFYSEEVRRGQVRSHGYQPSSEMMYPDDDKQLCFMDGSVPHSNMTGAKRQGSSEQEVKRRSLSSSLDTDRSHDQMLIKDYHHETRDPYQEKAFNNAGPNRPPSGQRHVEVFSPSSNIPEPFRRFLKGGENDERRNKRRSRFSDASPEEVKMAKETFREEYEPPYAQTGMGSRQGGGPLRSETQSTQYSDHYTELQSPQFSESYSRGDPESGGVFDMLKNVQIENAEEADFLKSKLSSILEEFKNKKMEKAVYDSQSRAGVSTNYGDSVPHPRDDSDHRRSEDPNFSHRRGWEQHDYIPEERQQEYNHPVQMESRHSSRGRYEDDPPFYPERFQESMHPQDYQPAEGEFFDPHSSAPPLQMEQDSRAQRDARYSNNLDKITSALLELVARK